MLLQELVKFYQRKASETNSNIARLGFEQKEIPFLIVISLAGEFKGFIDTRQGEGKKLRARLFTVPQAEKRTVGIKANLLWDNPAYIFALAEGSKTDRLQQQQAAFIERIKEVYEATQATSLNAILHFLQSDNYEAALKHELWPEIYKTGANLTFQIEGEAQLICEQDSIKQWVEQQAQSSGEFNQCLVTGELDEIELLHPAIKGVLGAQTAGANIVSFNLDAFKSHGKEQGWNAPIGKKAVFAYTTALNYMLRKDSGYSLQLPNSATVVFWGHEANAFEVFFAPLMGESNDYQDLEQIKAIFNSPYHGVKPILEDETRFYILGLAPNASRLAIRFWHVAPTKEIAQKILQYFEDINIVEPFQEKPTPLSIKRLLAATAVLRKQDNISPQLAGSLMQAILQGTRYPEELLAAALRRCYAEREITYPRAAIIKAVINRYQRIFQNNEKELTMGLDSENKSRSYLLGRLFAVLEHLQRKAIENIKETIRERSYAGAATTPAVVFPGLMKLSTYHLAKLDEKSRYFFQSNIENIINDLEPEFPKHLKLHEQGSFAIGYYHQRYKLFEKKKQENSPADESTAINELSKQVDAY